MPCSQVQLARVGVRVIVFVDVICVMLVVLIARVDVVHAVDTVFVAISVIGDVLFTPPVGDSELLLTVTEMITVILHQIHCETHAHT